MSVCCAATESGASAFARTRPAHLFNYPPTLTPFTMSVSSSGVKRHAQDDLDHAQRLAKRFELLELAKRPIAKPAHRLDNGRVQHALNPSTTAIQPPSTTTPHESNDLDHMELEDTKHRVYVHDLDKELEELEDDPPSDSEHPIFLADIEKHLMKLPKHVLQDDSTRKTLEDMQLVLYGVPTSLTVPEEKDSVRRAIIESRQRARASQALAAPNAQTAFADIMARNGTFIPTIDHEEDADEMDIG